MRVILLLWALHSAVLFAEEFASFEVSGEDRAVVTLQFSGKLKVRPKYTVEGNALLFTLAGVRLAPSFQGKLDERPSHFLLQRMSAVSPSTDVVKLRILINGTESGLYERIQVREAGDRLILSIAPPAGGASLALLKNEAEALSPVPAVSQPQPEVGNPVLRVGIALFVVLLLGAGVVLAVKLIKARTPWKGSRKYLIEQLSYCGLGPKQGVALIRVGKEFVLLGVSPGKVSFLSNMPKLSEQYEEESRYERGSFSSAVEEEFSKIHQRGINA